jgi:hypothetical protein
MNVHPTHSLHLATFPARAARLRLVTAARVIVPAPHLVHEPGLAYEASAEATAVAAGAAFSRRGS